MSTKRKVTFAEEDDNRQSKVMRKIEDIQLEVEAMHETTAKGKHSLDSDEEDVVPDNDGLKLDEIEGQEESKVDIEDGIRFTPFNLKEEYEEGEFDADGMYLFKKNKNQIKDNWIDDIDWAKVKQTERSQTLKEGKLSVDELPDSISVIALYESMLKLMKPGETVIKAIKRLGSVAKSGAACVPVRRNKQIWKTKTKTIAVDNVEVDPVVGSVTESTTADSNLPKQKQQVKSRVEPGKEDLLELIGCADKLLSLNGEMEIYQDTFERLTYKVKNAALAAAAAQPVDSGLDMFADETPAASNTVKCALLTIQHTDAVKAGEGEGREPTTTEVMWEYKWQNTDTEKIHGPFSSSEMFQWTQDNYFPDGVFVRKAATAPHGEFYTSRRIDFELYI